MELSYSVFDPTGNITVLVQTPVPAADQPRVASLLMAREPTCEQVGFRMPDTPGADITVRMAGGEFCGNASMSAAAWLCTERGWARAAVTVAIGGQLIPVTAEQTGEGCFRCAVTMPRPLRITEAFGLPLVELPGISHLIATAPMAREAAEEAIRGWCRALRADALGLMLLDEATGRLDPLVYVPQADTLFWERSCASGTAAVGAWAGPNRELSLTEPGGVLTVRTASDGTVTLEGAVRLERQHTAIL